MQTREFITSIAISRDTDWSNPNPQQFFPCIGHRHWLQVHRFDCVFSWIKILFCWSLWLPYKWGCPHSHHQQLLGNWQAYCVCLCNITGINNSLDTFWIVSINSTANWGHSQLSQAVTSRQPAHMSRPRDRYYQFNCLCGTFQSWIMRIGVSHIQPAATFTDRFQWYGGYHRKEWIVVSSEVTGPIKRSSRALIYNHYTTWSCPSKRTFGQRSIVPKISKVSNGQADINGVEEIDMVGPG